MAQLSDRLNRLAPSATLAMSQKSSEMNMISAVCIHRKHPDWKSSNTVKGGDAFRLFAMCIAVAIAFFCTLGQGIDSWICFGVYLGVGVVIWLWMVLVNWKKHPVEIETPDGIQKF